MSNTLSDSGEAHNLGPGCCRYGCSERATVLVTGPAGVPDVVVLLLMCGGCSLAASTAAPDVAVRALPSTRRRARIA
jgi:hypothetical protein